MKPYFSLITVTHQDAIGLEKTCNSILEQKFSDFEWIVVHSGAEDGTREKVANFELKPDYFISEKDEGIYDAMNKGLSRAQGQWVLFLNSADFLVKDVLFRVNEITKSDLSFDIVYGDCFLLREKGTFLKRARSPKRLWFGNYANHESIFLKLALVKNNNIRFDTKLKIAADYKFLVQLDLLKPNYFYLNFPVVFFGVDGVSSTQWKKLVSDQSIVRKEVLKFSITKTYLIDLMQWGWHFLMMNFNSVYRFFREKKSFL